MRKATRLVGPVIVIVVGAGLIIQAFSPIITSFGGPGISLLVPGETTFTVPKPGAYTLWSDVEGAFDGRLMIFPTGLPPGVTIKITKASDGTVVPLRSKLPITRQNSPGAVRVAIGTVTFDSAGSYRIVTEGLQEKRALHLDQLNVNNLFVNAGSSLLGTGLAVAGLVWAVAVLVSKPKS
jgi:hypothetical protein